MCTLNVYEKFIKFAVRLFGRSDYLKIELKKKSQEANKTNQKQNPI